MARLLKSKIARTTPVIVKVAKPPAAKTAIGKVTRGKFKKPPGPKKAKPTPVPEQDVGPFKGKF